MKRNVSVVKLCLYVSECACSKIIKELPGLVGSGTPCINDTPIEELGVRVMSTLLYNKGANVGNFLHHYTTTTMSVSPSQAFSD